MSESIHIPKGGTREEVYTVMAPQIEGLLAGETDTVANMANLSAVLHDAFGWHWVGFYFVKEDEFVLGPFQGPVACTRIRLGKGVCGAAHAEAKTMIIPDVVKFPAHIICSPFTKSEIVIPMIDDDGNVWAVLDVDSSVIDDFGEKDDVRLREFIKWIKPDGFETLELD